MNADVFEGKWRQMKGKVRETWGEITDDEIDQVRGNYENFLGLLQEKYGWQRERAERELEAAFEEDWD